ncbi:MAG: hypothetical protein AAGA08_11115 [Pseudomonadota bacterium]
MLSKVAAFLLVAFAVGTCERPEYTEPQLVGGFEYKGEGYQIVRMEYTTESSDGFAYFLFDPKTSTYTPTTSKAVCLDISLEECRTKFGQQLQLAAGETGDGGGMGY